MPAPNQSTFDGNPNANPPTTSGYRPGLPDFNGAALTDDTQNPPDPQTMPVSFVWNTFAYLIVSICRMIPCASFALTPGVSPSILWWFTAALNIASNPFAITRNGAGDYSVTWAANLFPVQGSPKAYLNSLQGAHNVGIQAQNITNGVRIQTVQDAVLTDLPFTVDVF